MKKKTTFVKFEKKWFVTYEIVTNELSIYKKKLKRVTNIQLKYYMFILMFSKTFNNIFRKIVLHIKCLVYTYYLNSIRYVERNVKQQHFSVF